MKRERTIPPEPGINTPIDYDKENDPIIIPKATLDLFLKEEKPADLIALYNFYYYTAKWQETNQPRATVSYASKGLKIGEDRIRAARKVLISLKVLEDVRYRDPKTNQIKGWYVRLTRIWKASTVQELKNNKPETFQDESHPADFTEGGSHPRHFPEGGFSQSVAFQEGNALSSSNGNALSSSNGNALSSDTPAREENPSPSNNKSSSIRNGRNAAARQKELVGDSSIRYWPKEFIQSREFRSSWQEWVEYRAAAGKPIEKLTKIGFRKEVARILKEVGGTPDQLIQAIDNAMARNWQGIWKPNGFNGNSKKRKEASEEQNMDHLSAFRPGRDIEYDWTKKEGKNGNVEG